MTDGLLDRVVEKTLSYSNLAELRERLRMARSTDVLFDAARQPRIGSPAISRPYAVDDIRVMRFAGPNS